MGRLAQTLGRTFSKSCYAAGREYKQRRRVPMLIFQLPKERTTKCMPSRKQQTSVRSSSKNTQRQRSSAPNHDHPPSNYRFSFGGFGTKVISVCGWRFAPACCAAQSVIRRGPGCAVPLHRLPWAAVNLNRRNELHQSDASAREMKTFIFMVSTGVTRTKRRGLTGRSTGHFAAVQVWASKA